MEDQQQAVQAVQAPQMDIAVLAERYRIAAQTIGDLVVEQHSAMQLIASLRTELANERNRADGLEAALRAASVSVKPETNGSKVSKKDTPV